MFGAEGRDRRREEKRPEQNQLVEFPRFLPIAMKKKRDQPDRKNRRSAKVCPNHRTWDCEECHDR
jgi:hypothetical protein